MSTSTESPKSSESEIKGPDDLARVFSVSRETVDRLKIYESSLVKWQKAVNLVAPKTLPDVWHRHFADSLQVASLVPQFAQTLADLGSGGGFPGLVLATYFADRDGPAVTLVESDQRKCAFLRDTARAMEISVEILSTRIENDANLSGLHGVDVLTARALAPLDRLLTLVAPYVGEATTCIFMKGRDAAREIEEARKNWLFEVSEQSSITEPSARLLLVKQIGSKTDAK